MEFSDQGDLRDIVPGSGSLYGGGDSSNNHQILASDWPFQSEPLAEGPAEDFDGPFSSFHDPLLHDLLFFDSPDSRVGLIRGTTLDPQGGDLETKRPCAIFSRVLQISPGMIVSPVHSPRHVIKPSPSLGCNMAKVGNGSVSFPMDHHSGLQISSPRTTLGIKRRKSQQKKVVCIPAPAASSSRSTGEAVPSDLWAWRKYGQKPIKGSPYPRGYYRCSSSKGCLARKQVERSKNDPKMLVVTYTSEHNHPWPTQRNALAGSTRSLPTKNTNSSVSTNLLLQRPLATVKEEQRETASLITSVKEESMAVDSVENGTEFDHVLRQTYKPMYPESNQPDDLFTDLGELDPDPMSLVLPKGFLGGMSDEGREDKNLDSFNMFDWAMNTYGESSRDS